MEKEHNCNIITHLQGSDGCAYLNFHHFTKDTVNELQAQGGLFHTHRLKENHCAVGLNTPQIRNVLISKMLAGGGGMVNVPSSLMSWKTDLSSGI